MTDAELIAAIRKILHTRPRKGSDAVRVDLARYDQIVGLIDRHPEPAKKPKPSIAVTDLRAPRTPIAHGE